MTDDELREYARRVFAHGRGEEIAPDVTPEPKAATDPRGPVIPGQASQPDMRERRSPVQKWINNLLNAGTAREYL